MDAQSRWVHELASIGIDLARLSTWLVLLLAIFAVVERRWPLHQQKVFRKAFGTDLVYYFLSGFAPKLLLALPISLIAAFMHRMGGGGYYAWAAGLPMAIRMMAAQIVGEVGAYWGHRWSHEIPFLWRFHAVHHAPEEIDWLISTHAHPVDMFFTRLCGIVPMYLVGLAQPMGRNLDLVPIVVILFGTVWGFFIHANLKWRLGWLEWFISSPAFHHWHHTNDGPETINKNFAPMLPWVDKLFGTFYLPKESWPQTYGTDTPVSPGLTGQLIQPLLTSTIPGEFAVEERR
jgi:sterol desaturase/sphingolipid hydroxylase (fatty acid hydroxylase superfamily)